VGDPATSHPMNGSHAVSDFVSKDISTQSPNKPELTSPHPSVVGHRGLELPVKPRAGGLLRGRRTQHGSSHGHNGQETKGPKGRRRGRLEAERGRRNRQQTKSPECGRRRRLQAEGGRREPNRLRGGRLGEEECPERADRATAGGPVERCEGRGRSEVGGLGGDCYCNRPMSVMLIIVCVRLMSKLFDTYLVLAGWGEGRREGQTQTQEQMRHRLPNPVGCVAWS
jgi:hypothetical protein